MRKRLLLALAAAVLALPALAAPAGATVGLSGFDVTFTNPDGSQALQAGSHPYAMRTVFDINTKEGPQGGTVVDEPLKNLVVGQTPGFAGDPTAVPQCATADFLATLESAATACADSSAVGLATVQAGTKDGVETFHAPVYNLRPAPGKAAKLGFWAFTVPVTVDIGVSEAPPYNVIATVTNISQTLEFFHSDLTLWGNPADPAHNEERGRCYSGKASCPAGVPETSFLISPRACQGPLPTVWEAEAWTNPGVFTKGSVLTHDEAEPPNPRGFSGCGRLGFSPSITAQPTSKAAESPTGLDFDLDVDDEGLINPSAIADSDIKEAEVTLPEGMSVNPSQAEGLAVCAEAQLAKETASSESGTGCPDASKIGAIEVETPLLENKLLKGSLYVAKPYENPFDSLIAFYIVIKSRELGINVVQAAKVTPDPVTGQLVTTTEDMPQLPFSHFRLHFREGTRSPLVTPPACGSYDVKALLTPWSGGAPIESTSTFQVISGPEGGPCPTGGLPPFHPHLDAGTLNNAAGRFSPFNVRLSRTDSEQEITHFSIKLPPGIAGKLAGIPFCTDAQIATATARTGPHGGQEELDSPSCPAASQVGRTLAGSGVGPSLAYAPGKVYLAGPYHGAPISFVSITAGVVGPFDIGTVVVRLAIKVNPETGEVFLDSTGSDPIPHIIKGIPIHLRDIRAYTDRPQFTFNPTSCERMSTAATVLGAGLDFASAADDNPFVSTSPFQAADCAALPFEPKLSLRLIGGTRRGAHPALHAHLAMNGFGEAGVAFSQVTLPHSEFIENAHFKTICTRVQFKAGGGNGEQCPAGSIYGHAKAVTPILSEPLEGPVFLRSSEHQLPDVVAALHGQEINVDLVGRVDSVKGGGIRNTFETVPDAPVTSADFDFEGAAKGLFVNSTNLCKATHRADVRFTGHNGKSFNYRPALRVSCHKHKGNKRTARRQMRAAR